MSEKSTPTWLTSKWVARGVRFAEAVLVQLVALGVWDYLTR